MSPAPVSPTTKMGNQHRTSQDSTSDGIRKRVCKACDRCRLKKSKCDGSSPCSRCKADNAICVFGERKKSQDKVYPKGYVEMLEQQQSQLVSGIQEMYHRLLKSEAWEMSPLAETNGAPLTHDILAALGLLEPKEDGSGEVEPFEEDCQRLQLKLISEGAGYVHRRGSLDSDSDHSPRLPLQATSHGTSIESKPTLFKENYNFPTVTSSPLTQSPLPRSRQFNTQPAQWQATCSPRLVPQDNSDPKLFAPEWEHALSQMHDPSQIMRSGFAMQVPELGDHFGGITDQWDQPPPQYDASSGQLASFQPQTVSNSFTNGMPDLTDMDLDFSKYVQGEGIMT